MLSALLQTAGIFHAAYIKLSVSKVRDITSALSQHFPLQKKKDQNLAINHIFARKQHHTITPR